MLKVSQSEFVNWLMFGDVCFCRGNSLFSKIQNVYRKLCGESKIMANHVFMMKDTPLILEAMARGVTGKNKINKYFTGHHKIWIFRPIKTVLSEREKIRSSVKIIEESDITYAGGGILEFIKVLFKKDMKDRAGVHCMELIGNLINAVDWPFIKNRPPHTITPSYGLDWFLNLGIETGWKFVAYYEGGKFFVK